MFGLSRLLFMMYFLPALLFPLTLKMPRKPASENVICLRHLLNILANFSNLFLHAGKQCGPSSAGPRGAQADDSCCDWQFKGQSF